MSKVLVITSRDVFSDGGEKNLMKNKDIALKAFGWETQYMVFRGLLSNPNVEADFNILGNFSILKGLLNARFISAKIREIKPDVVVFSGLLTYIFFFVLKIHGPKKSLDYQGALEEMVEYQNKGSGLLANFYYAIFKFLERKIYQKVNVVEVVSENCRIHLQATYGHTKAVFTLVPCGLVDTYDDEQYARCRRKWRAGLSIEENEVTAVFSGGVSKWQCIDDVMSFFAAFNGKAFFFTSTSNISFLKKLYPESNVTFSTLTPDELKEALCAFDFGLLPREVDITNFVAWPNKASEYHNARLTILIKNKEIGFYEQLQDACKIISFKNQQRVLEKSNYKYDASISSIYTSVEKLICNYLN